MSADRSDDRKKAPTGLFSGGSAKKPRPEEDTKTPAGGMLIPGVSVPPLPNPDELGSQELSFEDDSLTVKGAFGESDPPHEPGSILPPPPGELEDERPTRPVSIDLDPIESAGEDLLDELQPSEAPNAASSSYPEPLGHSEGHDAWTLERLSRQSTVPPVRTDDVDRLREMTMRSSPPPSDLGGGALDLVDKSRPSQQLDLLGEMEELYALDDLTGALRFAELVLGREPDNPQARRCAENCRARLITLYTSKIGDLDGTPIQAMQESELRWLGLDHRAGFLLSRVDGVSTIEEVLDVCGMPRLEALKTLADLLDRGAIRVEG